MTFGPIILGTYQMMKRFGGVGSHDMVGPNVKIDKKAESGTITLNVNMYKGQ